MRKMAGTSPVHRGSLPPCAAACTTAQAALHPRCWSAQMHKPEPSAHARRTSRASTPALPSSKKETGLARLTSLSPLLRKVSAGINDPGHQRGLWHRQLLQHVEVVCGGLVHGAAWWQEGAAGGCLGKGVGPTEDLQDGSRRGKLEHLAQGFLFARIPRCNWCTATKTRREPLPMTTSGRHHLNVGIRQAQGEQVGGLGTSSTCIEVPSDGTAPYTDTAKRSCCTSSMHASRQSAKQTGTCCN